MRIRTPKWVRFTLAVDRGPDLLIVNPEHVVCIMQTVNMQVRLTLSTGESYDITDSLSEVMRKLPSPEEEDDG